MAKIRSGGRSHPLRQQTDSEGDYHTPIDSDAVNPALALINADDNRSVTTEDVPESPSVAKLAHYEEQLSLGASTQDLQPAKIFGRPPSSGEVQPPIHFMMGAFNSNSKPQMPWITRPPLHQVPTAGRQNHAPQDLVEIQHQLQIEQSSSQSGPSNADSRITEPATSAKPSRPSDRSSPAINPAMAGAGLAHLEIESLGPQSTPVSKSMMKQTTVEDNGLELAHRYQAQLIPAEGPSFNFAPPARSQNAGKQEQRMPIQSQQKHPSQAEEQRQSELNQAVFQPNAVGQKEMTRQEQAANASKIAMSAESETIEGLPDVMTDEAPVLEVAEDSDIHSGPGGVRYVATDLMGTSPLAEPPASTRPLQRPRSRTPVTPSTAPKGPRPFRVTKPQLQLRIQSKARPTLEEQGPISLPAASEPSAEELLFLVMRRTRMKEQAERQLLVRQQDLETHNEQLQQQVQNSQADLAAALAREAQQKFELGAYKSRFNKLKDWAKNMSKSYEDLQKQSSLLKQSQKVLNVAKDEIRDQLQLTHISNTKTTKLLKGLRSEFAVVIRDDVQQMQQAVLLAQALLEEKEKQLCDVKAQNSRFEGHIKELATVNKKYNDALTREQRQNGDRLKQVEQVLEKIWADVKADPTQPPGIGQCLTLLEVLSNKNQLSPENLEPLQAALTTTAEKFTVYHNESIEAVASTNTMTTKMCSDMLARVTATVNSLRPEISKREDFSKLQEGNAQLEEKVRGKDVMVQEIRRGLNAAEARETNAQKSTQGILGIFAEGAQKAIISKAKSLETVSNMLTQMSIKYTNANTQCADEKNRADKNEETIKLKQAAEDKLKTELSATAVEREQLRQKLSEVQVQLKAQTLHYETGIESQVAERERQIKTVEEELQSSRKRLSEAVDEIERFKVIQEEQRDVIEKVRSETQAALNDSIRAKEDITYLESELSKLSGLREDAEKVPRLTSALEERNATILSLEARCTELDQVKCLNSAQKDNIVALSDELKSLGTQLQEAHKTGQAVDQLQQQASEASKQINILKGALTATQEKAERVLPLENETKKQSIEIASLTSKVKTLSEELSKSEEKASRFAPLATDLKSRALEVFSLEAKVNKLNQSLNEANKTAGQITSLENELRNKATELDSLNSTLETVSRELTQVQEQASKVAPLEHRLRQKTAELATLTSKLATVNDKLNDANEMATQVVSLEVKLRTQAAELDSLKSKLSILNSTLDQAEERAGRVALLEQDLHQKTAELDSLSTRLATLDALLKRAEGTAARVAPLEELIKINGTEIESLRSRLSEAENLSEAEKLSHQVRDLETPVNQWLTKFTDLEKEVDTAKHAAPNYDALYDALGEANARSDAQISDLQNKLAAEAQKVASLSHLEADRRTKDLEIATLRQKIAQMEEIPLETPDSYQQDQDGIPENFLSQDTILSLSPFTADHARNKAQIERSQMMAAVGTNSTGNERIQRRVAIRDQIRQQDGMKSAGGTGSAANSAEAGSRYLSFAHDSTLVDASDPGPTQRTNRVPDSQIEKPLASQTSAVKDSQERSGHHELSSSSLSEIDDMFSDSESDQGSESRGKRSANVQTRQQLNRSVRTMKLRGGDLLKNGRSSSSYGEPMLLEDLEQPEDEETPATQYANRLGSHVAPEDTLLSNVNARGFLSLDNPRQSPHPAMPWDKPASAFTTASNAHSGPSGSQTPLSKRNSSHLNMVPSSPNGALRERYQPNSAAKRRVEPDQTLSVGRSTTKRLKRMPRNLEVKKSSRDVPAAAGSGAATLSRHDTPSGSRKGTIVGTNAPPPGKGQRSKTTRKGSRNERYATRFSQEK